MKRGLTAVEAARYAALIAEAVIANGIDYGAGDSDVVSVHAEAIGYHVLDALREHGLTISRRH